MSGAEAPGGAGSSGARTWKVDVLTRVEGEGRFRLVVHDGDVVESTLSIFEAPRFFEAFLRGRSLHEVPDIVARICGICPVAYQVSAANALEAGLELDPGPALRRLRRLFYCGEWIESHALHVFLLHAPDYLGYPGGLEMAAEHREVVERGLRLRGVGDRILEVIGGRPSHPVSLRVGGFHRLPSPSGLADLRRELDECLELAHWAVDWTAGLDRPDYEQPYVFVSLVGEEYPLEAGRAIAVDGHGEHPVEAFDEWFSERQVPHSTALQCRLRDGSAYLCGPMARLAHSADRLHPEAARALRRTGLSPRVCNPHDSIVVRAVEILHAVAEARDLLDAWTPPRAPWVEAPLRPFEAAGASEAPRGLLWHRYRADGAGRIEEVRIVPPTAQNQARIEADLAGLAPTLLEMEREEATRLCERVIRSYDPCISCATHFLRLEVAEAEEMGGAKAGGRGGVAGEGRRRVRPSAPEPRTVGPHSSAVRVVVLGNEDAGDDAAALLAAGSLPPEVEALRAGRPGPALLDLLEGPGPVLLMDVVRTGAPPGTLHRHRLEGVWRKARPRTPASSHAFGPAEALALGERLGRSAPRGTLLGIEGVRFDPGEAPGPEVRAAIPGLAAAARREIRRLASESRDPGAGPRNAPGAAF